MSMTKMRSLSTKVDNKLSNAFGGLAGLVTNRPILTMVLTTAMAFALAPGMGMTEKQSNGEKLWTPQDTEAKTQQEWVMGVFGSASRRVQAYSTNNDANVLTHESLSALQQLHSGIKAVKATCEKKKGTCSGKEVTFDKVWMGKMSSILSLWGNSAPVAGTDILAVVNDESKYMTSGGDRMQVSDMLGGVTYDSNGKIVGAKAFLTTLWVKQEMEDVDASRRDPWTDAWEMEYDEYVKEFSSPAMSESYPYTQKGQSQAGGDAIRKDASMLGMGYMLLIVFSIIVLSHHKRIHSNGVMALASITCVGLSIVSAFGLCGYCGVRQNPVTTTLFLVLLGIGVDDSYVIMGDYRIAEGDAQTRVVQALTKGGVSIAVTSLTDIVAFAAGISSSLPAISDFCIFAAVGIFFDFFYQCTWFVAALMLRARCTENNRPDWLCCMTVDPESTGCCNCSAPLCSRKGQCVCCPCSRDSPDGTGMGDSAARRTLNKVTALTLTPIGTGVVLFITACILGGAAAGFPKLNTDFDIKWFTPDDAFYKTTYDIQDKYFPTTGKGLPVYVYTKTGDYAAAHSDASLAALYQGTTACAWVDRSVTNWYSDFAKDAGRTSRAQASNAAFTSEVKAFVSSPAGARFAKDISFASDDSSILATRTMYLSKATENGEEDIEMMETIRGCVGTTLSAFAYTRAFLYYDGLAVVDTETITNVLIACACVFVVTLFMLADLLAATLVLTMIGLIDVCILGYMGHWDLDFNSVTAVNLVLAIGLAIDYSAHIAHSFLVIQGPGPERAKRAVDHIGMSVLNGAFSTFLAVLPLGVSQSYVFRVFFKMWFMIIIFGTFFGVIVLPVLLSLFSNCLGAPYVPEAADQTVQVDVKPEGLNPIAVGKAGNKDEVYLQKE